jgi:tetraacyldisaccharide 4'-kinase
MALRRRAYEAGLIPSTEAAKPVISIGNLTLGGNGKTPMCVYLAKALAEKGLKAAILSRGYGRIPDKSRPEPLLVSQGQGPMVTALEGGDEPYLMALKTEALVILAKKRPLAAELATKSGADVLILDDGFQRLDLKRDLDILMLRSGQNLSKERVVPAGYLRERAETHQKAHLLVVLGQRLDEYALKLANGRPTFLARMVPAGLTALADGRPIEPAQLRGRALGAFCGLARPGSFFKSLSEKRFPIKAHLCFPDHVTYDSAALSRLRRFKDLNRVDYLLTSLKDAVKLPPSLPLPILCLEATLTLDRPHEFMNETLSRLNLTEEYQQIV